MLTHELWLTLAQSSRGGAGGGAGGSIVMIVWLAIIVLAIAGLWKTFAKAGQPGWAAIVPIYNLFILTKVAGRPAWWLVLFFIPIVSIIAFAIVSFDIAKAFGKGPLFGVGLWLLSPIFFCVLGFGQAQYQGPSTATPSFAAPARKAA